MKPRIFFILLILLIFQTARANYAFYNTVKKTCLSYRVPIQQTDMLLEENGFSINLNSNRNNFEMIMMIGFVAAGQAIRHQYYLEENHNDYSPVIPEKISIRITVPVERNQMTIFATASSEQVYQLAEGAIESVDFIRQIKDSIQTL